LAGAAFLAAGFFAGAALAAGFLAGAAFAAGFFTAGFFATAISISCRWHSNNNVIRRNATPKIHFSGEFL
jgi:hypothetical protein